MFELNDIIATLIRLKPELMEKYNISSLGLFGSVVRRDFTQTSDVDIIVEFAKPIGIEFVDLADFIEMHLKKRVDLVSKKGVKPLYFEQIKSEIVYV